MGKNENTIRTLHICQPLILKKILRGKDELPTLSTSKYTFHFLSYHPEERLFSVPATCITSMFVRKSRRSTREPTKLCIQLFVWQKEISHYTQKSRLRLISTNKTTIWWSIKYVRCPSSLFIRISSDEIWRIAEVWSDSGGRQFLIRHMSGMTRITNFADAFWVGGYSLWYLVVSIRVIEMVWLLYTNENRW